MLDSLPKTATITTTTMIAIRPPLLMLKEDPEPEAPASESMPVPLAPLGELYSVGAALGAGLVDAEDA